MKLFDYLLYRTPSQDVTRRRLGTSSEPGTIPTGRVILSILGLLVGVFVSFLVVDLTKASIAPLDWNRAVRIGIVTLVICGLSYQGLYFSLKLYEKAPAIIVFFAAFQYGYFWQSVIGSVTGLNS